MKGLCDVQSLYRPNQYWSEFHQLKNPPYIETIIEVGPKIYVWVHHCHLSSFLFRQSTIQNWSTFILIYFILETLIQKRSYLEYILDGLNFYSNLLEGVSFVFFSFLYVKTALKSTPSIILDLHRNSNTIIKKLL